MHRRINLALGSHAPQFAKLHKAFFPGKEERQRRLPETPPFPSLSTWRWAAILISHCYKVVLCPYSLSVWEICLE